MAVNSIDDVVPSVDRGRGGLLDSDMAGQLFAQPGLIPQLWLNDPGDETPALAWALRSVLRGLANRSPRIEPEDIVDPLELQHVVITGAEARVYFMASTSGTQTELYAYKHQTTQKLFEAQIKGLNPLLASTGGNQRPGPMTIGITRG